MIGADEEDWRIGQMIRFAVGDFVRVPPESWRSSFGVIVGRGINFFSVEIGDRTLSFFPEEVHHADAVEAVGSLAA